MVRHAFTCLQSHELHASWSGAFTATYLLCASCTSYTPFVSCWLWVNVRRPLLTITMDNHYVQAQTIAWNAATSDTGDKTHCSVTCIPTLQAAMSICYACSCQLLLGGNCPSRSFDHLACTCSNSVYQLLLSLGTICILVAGHYVTPPRVQ